ncbi:TRAP transporter small permease [Desulfopila sp. IMCC35008]|uniref:TRAP transporter small permease n=1 Tax=Desulfopila sp. IMCC35008 TaxID=2653858 RepID=UPI0013D4E85F|nr:TRAP transporter small permease [Desulfopila sp. IMCC35008]
MVRKILDRLYLVSGWVGAGFIALICLLVVMQVTLNLVDRLSTVLTGSAIGLTIPSYADFTGFFLASASFLALAYTLREGGHIRVTLVIGNLPEGIRRLFEVWCVGLATFIAGYFVWYTARLVHESYVYNDLSAGMIAVPIWIPQSGMLIGLIVLLISLLDEFVRVVAGRPPSYFDKGEKLLKVEGDAQEESDV